MAAATPLVEAVVLGRVGVDLTPPSPRTSLGDASSFIRAVGGYAGNVATGLARLGVGTAIASSVGDDGHGAFVRGFLANEGIDVSNLVVRPATRTQVAFFEAWPPETFPVTFYRPAPAPETLATLADLGPAVIETAPLVIVSGSLLAAEPARSSVLRALQLRASAPRHADRWTVFDVDWRPALWAAPHEAPELVRRAVSLSDVVIGSDDELAAVRLPPREALVAGVEYVAVKHGAGGSSLVRREGGVQVAGHDIDVICGLGAGDAFAAALTAGLLRGGDVERTLARANAAGAIVASRLMCSTAMPTATEIEALLASSRERTGARA
jgi:5-dehydro-2-deoxygluconokinase